VDTSGRLDGRGGGSDGDSRGQGVASGGWEKGVVDISSKGEEAEGAGESGGGLWGGTIGGELDAARWSARGKGSAAVVIGLLLGVETGDKVPVGKCAMDNGAGDEGGISAEGTTGVGEMGGDKGGGEKLTWGRNEAADSVVPVAESGEVALSLAGNEASSKTTCLERYTF
jgi:hypothetical protein